MTSTGILLCIVKIAIGGKSHVRTLFKRSHSVSERFYILICASVRASVPKPQFHYLHNKQLCQFMSDWLLSLATRILVKILAI